MKHNISNLPVFKGLKQRVVWLANEFKTLGTWTGTQITSILNLLGIFQTGLQQAQLDIINLQSQAGIIPYQIDLYKTDINNLHTTPIVISNTDLGLGAEDIAVPVMVIISKYRDSSDFATAGLGIALSNLFIDGSPVYILPHDNLEVAGDSMFMRNILPGATLVDIVFSNPHVQPFYINTDAEITGGGANSYISIKIYYTLFNHIFSV